MKFPGQLMRKEGELNILKTSRRQENHEERTSCGELSKVKLSNKENYVVGNQDHLLLEGNV